MAELFQGMRHRNGASKTNKESEEEKELRVPLSPDESTVFVMEHKAELKFWHWIGYFVWILLILILVNFLDNHLPAVTSKNDYTKFSEHRAREFLEKLSSFPSRTSGSHAMENETLDLMLDRLANLETLFSETKVNTLELEVHRPTGCFNLGFLSPFTSCYDNVTNILIRISPHKNSNRPALLLNCHLDSVSEGPGASDDALACTVYLDLLEILARRATALENDLIILFNSAEENFLQGSHGFVDQHRWFKDTRAFLNLEATGAGGREILFQATKKDSWLLETYLKEAPHPHCNVIAQELFQSGIIPSDTDFSVYRDYGYLSGLDFAYYKNGWIYHTEFDKVDIIPEGAIQRAGDNFLALTDALLASPKIRSNESSVDTKWVFYDVLGLFAIHYSAVVGTIINCVACLLVGILIAVHLSQLKYSWNDLLFSFLHHVAVFAAMLAGGFLIVGFVYLLNLTMAWYSDPCLVLFLYIIPMLSIGFYVHSMFTLKQRGNNKKPKDDYRILEVEQAHYDASTLIFALLLLLVTISGIASAYVFFILVLFLLLREPILIAYTKIAKRDLTPFAIFITQFFILAPAFLFVCYFSMLFISFFVPVMGRFGNALFPELFVMPLCFIISYIFILLSSNFVYLTRPYTLLFKILAAVLLFIFVLILSTRFGNPYKWTDDGIPRLKRVIAMHTKRTIYDLQGEVTLSENALFLQSLDYRGVNDLPNYELFNDNTFNNVPDCSKTKDLYCQLPFYVPTAEMLPSHKSRWVHTKEEPPLKKPLKLELLDRRFIDDSKFGQQLNLSFSLKGGSDKLQVHLTPLSDYKLKSISVIDHIHPEHMHPTYFIFWTYGYKAPEERRFWIMLERQSSQPTDANKRENIEIVVTTQQVHGNYQNSTIIQKLREEVVKNRQIDWKWAMTLSPVTAEVVSHVF